MGSLKGRHFAAEVTLRTLRWYLITTRRATTPRYFCWMQTYAADLEKRLRSYLRLSNGSWRVDETYIKVKGCRTYLDRGGQTIDFLLSAKRDMAAAEQFFRKALGQPRTIMVDKNAAYPKAVAEMKTPGKLRRRSWLRQCKYLNNITEQDHRRIKAMKAQARLIPLCQDIVSRFEQPQNSCRQKALAYLGKVQTGSSPASAKPLDIVDPGTTGQAAWLFQVAA